MDRDVSDDQKMLLDASGRFIEEICSLRLVRETAYANPAYAADYRSRAAALGWFSMLVPEDLGGGSVSGNGMVDAALIAYKRGAGLQPGPFVPTNVVAYALGLAGTEEQQKTILPSLISGEESASWAMADSRWLLAARSPAWSRAWIDSRSSRPGWTGARAVSRE